MRDTYVIVKGTKIFWGFNSDQQSQWYDLMDGFTVAWKGELGDATKLVGRVGGKVMKITLVEV